MGRRASEAGFTLMEMLVVIAIISMLSGLLLSGVVVARRRAVGRRALLQLVRIAVACEAYGIDFGDYPPGDGEEGSGSMLYIALATNRMNGPYLTGLTKKELVDLDFDGVKEIVDPWQQPIRYMHHSHYDEEPGMGRFRITCNGPDGVPD